MSLSKKINIEIEELKLGLDEQEVPRVEEEDEYYLIIYKAPLFEEDITTTSFGIFIKDNIILTIHIDKINSIGKIYNLLKTKKPKILLDRGIGFFLYVLLNQITLSYSRIILNLEDELDRLEDVLLKNQDKNITGEILQLRKTLVYFHKALVSNKDVLSILKRKYLPITTQDDRDHIEDLYYDTLQLIDMETTYRELLVSMMDMIDLSARTPARQPTQISCGLRALQRRFQSARILSCAPASPARIVPPGERQPRAARRPYRGRVRSLSRPRICQ
jgi:magnesium transporter